MCRVLHIAGVFTDAACVINVRDWGKRDSDASRCCLCTVCVELRWRWREQDVLQRLAATLRFSLLSEWLCVLAEIPRGSFTEGAPSWEAD